MVKRGELRGVFVVGFFFQFLKIFLWKSGQNISTGMVSKGMERCASRRNTRSGEMGLSKNSLLTEDRFRVQGVIAVLSLWPNLTCYKYGLE